MIEVTIADLSRITLHEAIRNIALQKYEFASIEEASRFGLRIDDPLIYNGEDISFALDSSAGLPQANMLRIFHLSKPYPQIGEFVFDVDSEAWMNLDMGLRILATKEFRPFKQEDWYAYSGAGHADALIHYGQDLVYIVGSSDGEALDTLEITTFTSIEQYEIFGDLSTSKRILFRNESTNV